MLDFGDVVIHLFTAEQREYYDLESFYGAAEEVRMRAAKTVHIVEVLGGAAELVQVMKGGS